MSTDAYLAQCKRLRDLTGMDVLRRDAPHEASTPTENFLVGYDAYPFGPSETRIAGTPEWRGWWTMHREAVRKHRPRTGPYKPRLSGSDAAINTLLRCL